ncbi:tRNA (N6-threonylcarbamoyladenosine(37)-N6)-methyltransferase TrmO [Desulfatibacillum aliphaticivorans]|uniref:tRNA (N6-threonylcarbamoyladenosine(37)-N6)-methyltransferase TrmO n=1 Tax=Desulfatibacillum aliphaticivorans TaxID=218208 RepID=UPI00041C39E5|nr:tRNA (N6-threonylcarbamoyladenosine(37)-N6)-methyltransferase TrmO [Desulfatibacillum aliphaticivorans]
MIQMNPIGTIHTPFKETQGMPIQPAGARGVEGALEVLPELAEGLKDVDGFSHVIILYHFHQSNGYNLRVTPFLDKEERGVFSTRAPKRPNPIGLSVVEVVKVEGNIVHVKNIDVLDGTPLLDIKPYVPKFDTPEFSRTGWLEEAQKNARKTRADERFK